MGFPVFLKKKTTNKAVFLGLDNSGKSTILSFFQDGCFVEHMPTMGKKKIDFEIGGTRISLFDIGGRQDFRQMWLGEIKNANCVIFVIDMADKERFSEVSREFDKIVPYIKAYDLNLLIFANKYDLALNIDLIDIINVFNLENLEQFEIMEISAKTGYGMADAFVKLYTVLTGENAKKNVIGKAISVFDKECVPIITTYNKSDMVRIAIEKNLLFAIMQFSKIKEADDVESNLITFESERNGTFIVAKSKNLIASLLWTEDLNIPIEQSKTALRNLLNHLESNVECEDTNSVAFYMEHYCTNII